MHDGNLLLDLLLLREREGLLLGTLSHERCDPLSSPVGDARLSLRHLLLLLCFLFRLLLLLRRLLLHDLLEALQRLGLGRVLTMGCDH
jgi:hypothetical protein